MGRILHIPAPIRKLRARPTEDFLAERRPIAETFNPPAGSRHGGSGIDTIGRWLLKTV